MAQVNNELWRLKEKHRLITTQGLAKIIPDIIEEVLKQKKTGSYPVNVLTNIRNSYEAKIAKLTPPSPGQSTIDFNKTQS